MKALVVAEWHGDRLLEATARLVSATASLEVSTVDLLLAGAPDAVARKAARVAGVCRVLHAPDASPLPESMAALLRDLIRHHGHTAIIGATSRNTHAALARLAGLLGVMPVTDVARVLSPDTFVRPMHAGRLLATVRNGTSPRLLTLRATAFPPAEESRTPAPVERIAPPDPKVPVPRVISTRETAGSADLSSARIVIGFGQGASDASTRALIMELAERLGAAVGTTRAVVDAGLAPGEWQIGQTGRTIAPELYLAFGISGAQQHLAGIADAKTVVAINTDAEAPIFAHADHGLVADAGEVLRVLLDTLPRRAGS